MRSVNLFCLSSITEFYLLVLKCHCANNAAYFLTALTPKNIRKFFTPIIELARHLKEAETLKQVHDREPTVTVSYLYLCACNTVEHYIYIFKGILG